jgi:hypothetical protein
MLENNLFMQKDNLISYVKQKIPEISEITDSDKEIYKNFFNNVIYKACYSCGWIYITQSARFMDTQNKKMYLGLKFLTGDCLMTLGIHKDHFVIIRPLGNYLKYLPSLLENLKKISGKNVYIKKMTPEEIAKLENLVQLSKAKENYPWGKSTPEDDDTFPEIIIDIDKALKYDDTPCRELKNIRTNIHRFSRNMYLFSWNNIPGNDNWRLIGFFKKRFGVNWVTTAKIEKIDDGKTIKLSSKNHYLYLKLDDKRIEVSIEIDNNKTNKLIAITENSRLNIYNNITIMSYNKELRQAVFEYLRQHFGEDYIFAYAYKNMLDHPPNGSNGKSFFSFIAVFNERIVGFFLAERVDVESAAVYASIGSREPELRGLTEFLFIRLMEILKNAGIKYLNLGGSEVISLHRFKMKFSPSETKKLDIYVYGL